MGCGRELLETLCGVGIAVTQTLQQPFACRGQESRGPNLEGGVRTVGVGPDPAEVSWE